MPLHPSKLLDVPALRALTPVILAAWDDEFLTPAELLAVRDALERNDALDPAAKETLRAWLNPEAPPSAPSMRALSRAWREGGTGNTTDVVALQRLLSALDVNAYASKPVPRTEPRAVPAADISLWRVALDGEQHAVRDSARELLSDERFRTSREHDMRVYREQVLRWVMALSGLPVIRDETSHAPGPSVAKFVAAFETIALFDLSLVVKFGVQFGLFAGAIQHLGTAEHHALLPAIARCELIGCFAMTERAHGSNVRGLETVGRYDAASQEFVITTPRLAAGKEWIGNAALHARLAVVFGQLETGGESYGVHAWLVPIRDTQGALLPGVRAEDCGHKMGLNGVDNGRLWFDDVRVPRSALLDRFGQVALDGSYSSPIPSASKRFFTMLGTLVGGRINVAGGALAASKVGLTIALRYGSHRHQFPDAQGVETPVLDYLSHQQRLLPALAAAYAFSFAQQGLLRHMADAEKHPELGRDIGTLAAGIKAAGTWQAIATLQQCRECCGGQGYLTSNRIDSLRTDADVFTTFEGDNTVLMQLVAKDLLREYTRQLEDSPLRAFARSVASDVAVAVTHKRLAQRFADEQLLLQPAFQLDALRYRERSLVTTLERRVQRRIDDGMSATEAFEACQDHALALGHAHIARFVLESFQQAVGDDETLKQLCALFGLTRLENELGWFLENDYLAASQSRAMRKQRNALLAALKPSALALVEAFAIPSTCLGPLADPAYLLDSGLAPEPLATSKG